MKKRKNILFRLICLLLCVAMMLMAASCVAEPEESDADATEAESEAETEPVETMKVVVFSAKAAKGIQLNKYRLELADVPVTELPVDPITNIDDAMGKYLLVDVTKGSCVAASMLSKVDPLVSANGLGADYVLIDEVISAHSEIKDTSEIIQKAIEENPGKTIYFPDGKYQLTKTIVIPSDPAKSVSFRLSNYAILEVANGWAAENTAVIQYGSAESPKTQSGDHADYIMGGIINPNDKATAIEIYGGGRLFVSNVALKNAKIGIHVKPNGAYNDIENVNVTSPERGESKGIFVEGTNNTFTNMRIYHAFIGAHLKGGDNVLINIHPLANPSGNLSSAGFYDQSSGNRYSICYSDQYPVGFKVEAQSRSYFDTCFTFWWQAVTYQIGFMSVGEFNSIISDSTVSMQIANNLDGVDKSRIQNHYLYFSTDGKTATNQEELAKGSGVIINPKMSQSNNSDSDTYKQFVYNPN